MRFSTGKKKTGRPAFSPSQTRSRKTPKLYRPSDSFPFPEASGKTVADVYVTTEHDRSCVTLRFHDNTELVIEIESCLSFAADYSDWKTGNEQVIKSWPGSSKPRKSGKRPLGLFRGQIWMAPDFDAPMELIEDGEGWLLVPAKPSATGQKDKVANPVEKSKRNNRTESQTDHR